MPSTAQRKLSVQLVTEVLAAGLWCWDLYSYEDVSGPSFYCGSSYSRTIVAGLDASGSSLQDWIIILNYTSFGSFATSSSNSNEINQFHHL
ncbi:hypothetical protein KEM48_012941 [Puccinia striiformis f. sp. tritici PST-130]|nr:hypothetical protein KEM48_012941 [Puccinia striiformis f. sp. tritici PST-130]